MADEQAKKGRVVASIDFSDDAPGDDSADAKLQARIAKADAHIDGFVDGALTDREGGPSGALAQSDEDKKREAMLARRSRWDAQLARVAQMAHDNPQFGEQARQHVWSIYIRQKRIVTIDDAIFGFILAERYYDLVRNKIEAGEFWEIFYQKIAYALTDVTDEYGSNLIDYVSGQDAGAVGSLVICCEVLADWATDHKDGDKARGFVRRLFTEARDNSGRAILDSIRLTVSSDAEKRCVEALDAMDGKIERADALKFKADDLYALMKEGKKEEAVRYLRTNARDVRPSDVQTAFEDKGLDLFRVDIVGAGKGDTGKEELLQGALANQYAKAGVFNLEYAKHKMLREKGRVSQGRTDERGWNNYMQLAAQADFNPAFMENEHEFWDHMFKQMAHFRYKRPGNTKSVRELELEVARDLLDRPAKNGMTAFHIAAKHGNAVVIKYLLNKLFSFHAANAFKQAQSRGVEHAKLVDLKKRQVPEMRENLAYLTAGDKSGANVFMHALVANRSEIVQLLVGRFQEHPQYLEILSQLKVPLDGKKVTLDDFASRDFGHGRNTESQRLLRRVLQDAADRLQMRQQGGARVA